jgi:hypothetical protein
MSDIQTVLIEDSRIADLTDKDVFGVVAGASQSTFQQFQAVSASNSSIVFALQIPNENIVVDRHILLQTTLNFSVNINAQGVNGGVGVPAGSQAFQYGLTDCLQAFPLNSLFTTTQSTINNVSVSTNLQDVLPMLSRMNDNRMLSRYNSLTPSYVDNQWGVYSNAVLTNSNPLASYNNNGYDEDFEPRGAYALQSILVQHYVAGVLTDNSVISTGLTDNWVISIVVQLTEPFLALSPYINCQPNSQAGLLGINNLSFVLNVDSSCKRLFSTANTTLAPIPAGGTYSTGLSSFITSITLGTSTQPSAFQNTRLLFNFLSLQPEQYSKISTKNVVPFLDYPRYLTISNNNTSIAPFNPAVSISSQIVTLTSQSIQLNQVPDLILISVRIPMSSQNWSYTSSFLAIKSIAINFNNASGLLSTATTQDLYNMSFRNGSQQSFYEFNGVAGVNNNTSGVQSLVPTTGSLLVLSPSMDFSLPSYLSASSLGQFQFQFNIGVVNQFPWGIVPEICIITMNSGIFCTQTGTSQIFTGLLTKQQVLQTKEQTPVPHLESSEYQRLVGGKLGNFGMSNVLKMIRERPLLKHARSIVGAGTSGGVMSAGVMSGGKRSKLDKYLS